MDMSAMLNTIMNAFKGFTDFINGIIDMIKSFVSEQRSRNDER